jgi:hypothetical protein
MKKVIGIAAAVGLAFGGIGTASADFSGNGAGFDGNFVVVETVASDTEYVIWGGVGCNCFIPAVPEIFYWE